MTSSHDSHKEVSEPLQDSSDLKPTWILPGLEETLHTRMSQSPYHLPQRCQHYCHYSSAEDS